MRVCVNVGASVLCITQHNIATNALFVQTFTAQQKIHTRVYMWLCGCVCVCVCVCVRVCVRAREIEIERERERGIRYLQRLPLDCISVRGLVGWSTGEHVDLGVNMYMDTTIG